MNEHLPWSEQIRTIVQNFTALPAIICPGETLLHHAMIEDADRVYALKARAVECPSCGAPAGVNCLPIVADKSWNHPERAARQHMMETLYG